MKHQMNRVTIKINNKVYDSSYIDNISIYVFRILNLFKGTDDYIEIDMHDLRSNNHSTIRGSFDECYSKWLELEV